MRRIKFEPTITVQKLSVLYSSRPQPDFPLFTAAITRHVLRDVIGPACH